MKHQMNKINLYNKTHTKDVLWMLLVFAFGGIVFVWDRLYAQQNDTSLGLFVFTLFTTFTTFGCYGVAICISELDLLNEELKEKLK